ncbi:MAG: ORF6N domain-containing protein [Flavobacteriales bacterium]
MGTMSIAATPGPLTRVVVAELEGRLSTHDEEIQAIFDHLTALVSGTAARQAHRLPTIRSLNINTMHPMPTTYTADPTPALVKEPPFGYRANPFPDEGLVRRTHTLRGEFVVLENDLAGLYGVDLPTLREQVDRHASRFPGHTLFHLSAEEVEALPVTVRRHVGEAPRAYTAAGVLMLACVVGSERAVAISVRIMALFVRMRQVLVSNQDLLLRLERLGQRSGEGMDIASTLNDLEQLFSPTLRN